MVALYACPDFSSAIIVLISVLLRGIKQHCNAFLRTAFFKICIEVSDPAAGILCSIIKIMSEISGAAFLHVRLTVFRLSRLISVRRHSSISRYLIG